MLLLLLLLLMIMMMMMMVVVGQVLEYRANSYTLTELS